LSAICLTNKKSLWLKTITLNFFPDKRPRPSWEERSGASYGGWGIAGAPKASIPESHEFDLPNPLIMARSYAVTSMELSGGVFGGVLVSGFVTFSDSDEGLPLLSCNSNPLLVNEGWEGLTFSGKLLTGPTESILNTFLYYWPHLICSSSKKRGTLGLP